MRLLPVQLISCNKGIKHIFFVVNMHPNVLYCGMHCMCLYLIGINLEVRDCHNLYDIHFVYTLGSEDGSGVYIYVNKETCIYIIILHLHNIPLRYLHLSCKSGFLTQ